MYYEKTILDTFELWKDFSWTWTHSGLQLDSDFLQILSVPEILQKTLDRHKIWAGLKLDTMFAIKVELKSFHGSIIGFFIRLLFWHWNFPCNTAYNVVSVYAPSFFTIQKNHKSLKTYIIFQKT